jgi:aclacinomycin oxidase
MYSGLTDDAVNPGTLILFAGYGGAVNAVAPAATASVARRSVLKIQYGTFWTAAADDDRNIGQIRRLYQAVHAGSGGVPVSNDITDGAFINYADVDLADPAWNTSGVGWQTLYYGANYPRLQRAKKTWDPGDLFNHALSVEPAR